jgi:hypothetical protein
VDAQLGAVLLGQCPEGDLVAVPDEIALVVVLSGHGRHDETGPSNSSVPASTPALSAMSVP